MQNAIVIVIPERPGVWRVSLNRGTEKENDDFWRKTISVVKLRKLPFNFHLKRF